MRAAAARRTAIRRKLLAWYDRNRRDLPWRRRESDAYAQWIAEIMLQQTRVETVERYYERFLDRFPDAASLARAREATVMKAWEGLGYYRRARNLHLGTKEIARRGGEIPDTSIGLRELSGIGEYTAAAIASIAYKEPVAAVDGNVSRVIARLFAVTEDIRSAAGQSKIGDLATELLFRSRPGDFNQAWMDLGSLICTPQAPKCPACPLRDHCEGSQRELADSLPNVGKKKAPRKVNLVACAFYDRGRVLMTCSEDGEWWSGLWGLPSLEFRKGTSQARAVNDLALDFGVRTVTTKIAGTVRHQLTHRSLTFNVFVCDVEKRDDTRACKNLCTRQSKWVSKKQLEKLAVSTAHRKMLAAVDDAAQTRRPRKLSQAIS